MSSTFNSMQVQPLVGLVLSGGGAKGAYQAGVLRGLAELGVVIDAVSGASIGSLNAAMVASAPNLHVAAERMVETWRALGSSTPPTSVNHKGAALMALTLAASLASVYLPVAGPVVRAVVAGGGLLQAPDVGLYCDEHVGELIKRYINLNALSGSMPMWVSLYASQGLVGDLKAIVGGVLGGDTAASKFLRINELANADERLKALLASAAIPLAFPRQQINGKKYVDGGIGGWKTSSGNTPITPLIAHGCKRVIVTHLSDGALWNRHDYPDTTVIEIRPSGIARKGALGDLLGFELSSIESWMEQGYRDTLRCMEPIRQALEIRDVGARAEAKRDAAVNRLRNDDFHID